MKKLLWEWTEVEPNRFRRRKVPGRRATFQYEVRHPREGWIRVGKTAAADTDSVLHLSIVEEVVRELIEERGWTYVTWSAEREEGPAVLVSWPGGEHRVQSDSLAKAFLAAYLDVLRTRPQEE